MLFSPLLLGTFNGCSADGDDVMDGLHDGLTDESDDVQMDRKFPGITCFRKLNRGILIGIFTMNLADGWMDRTDNRHTDGQRWNHILVGRQTSHAIDIQTDLL